MVKDSEMGTMREEQVVILIRNMKSFSQFGRSAGRHPNRRPLEYEAGVPSRLRDVR